MANYDDDMEPPRTIFDDLHDQLKDIESTQRDLAKAIDRIERKIEQVANGVEHVTKLIFVSILGFMIIGYFK